MFSPDFFRESLSKVSLLFGRVSRPFLIFSSSDPGLISVSWCLFSSLQLAHLRCSPCRRMGRLSRRWCPVGKPFSDGWCSHCWSTEWVSWQRLSGASLTQFTDIPYFRTFTMPWTKCASQTPSNCRTNQANLNRTSEFPHPFLSPPVESPTFNSAS